MDGRDTELAGRVRAALPAQPRCYGDGSLTPSAVLLALVDRSSGPEVIFTRRTMTVAKHKGQISLPGGAAEPEDDGPVDTALREAFEEIALPKEKVRVIGRMNDQPTTTGFVITPIVGLVQPPLELRADPAEVEEIFEVPLAQLIDPANRSVENFYYEGQKYRDYRFNIGKHVIWGATGRIIDAFLQGLENGGKDGKGHQRHHPDPRLG